MANKEVLLHAINVVYIYFIILVTSPIMKYNYIVVESIIIFSSALLFYTYYIFIKHSGKT